MVFYPVPTDRDFDIVIPIFAFFAVLTTVFRLWDRARTRHFGVDDAFAAVALAFHVLFLTVFYLFLQFPGQPSQREGVIIYYLLVSSFPGVIWMARISITFSVMRIVPYSHQRRWLGCLVALFVVFWLFLLAQPIWTCEGDPAWKTTGARPQCDLGIQRGACELAFDIIGDMAILLTPLSFLWKLKLQHSLRLRLILLFSTSIFVTIVSLIHDVIVLQVGSLPEIFAALLQDNIALIVCNMTVVVTSLYRIFSPAHTDLSGDAGSERPAERDATMAKSRSFVSKSVGRLGTGRATTIELVSHVGRGNELAASWADDLEIESRSIDGDFALDDLKKPGQALPSDTSSVVDVDDKKSSQPFSGFRWASRDVSDQSDREGKAPIGIFVERQVHIERTDSL